MNRIYQDDKEGFLVAAALGHERRIINCGGNPDGIGSFTYVMMDAP